MGSLQDAFGSQIESMPRLAIEGVVRKTGGWSA